MNINQTVCANIPVILTDTTGIPANAARAAWSIQNLSTNTLYILRGTGASSSVFHTVLKAGTAQDDGTGGFISEEAGTIFIGPITVAGTSPRYVVYESGSVRAA